MLALCWRDETRVVQQRRSTLVLVPTRFALDTPSLQKDYDSVWSSFGEKFKP